MAKPPPKPTFLATATYRQRRLRDVAMGLPVLGAVLFTIPLLSPRDGLGQQGTSDALRFLFLSWFCLIIVGRLVARKIRSDSATEE